MGKYQIWCIYQNQSSEANTEWSLHTEVESLDDLFVAKREVNRIATNRVIITKAIDVEVVAVEL